VTGTLFNKKGGKERFEYNALFIGVPCEKQKESCNMKHANPAAILSIAVLCLFVAAGCVQAIPAPSDLPGGTVPMPSSGQGAAVDTVDESSQVAEDWASYNKTLASDVPLTWARLPTSRVVSWWWTV
jgi:hypothetical protein